MNEMAYITDLALDMVFLARSALMVWRLHHPYKSSMTLSVRPFFCIMILIYDDGSDICQNIPF